MKNNRLAQSGGPLQTFMIVIVIVGFFSVAGLSFLTGLGNQYGTTIADDSAFNNVNAYSQINESTEKMRNSLNDLTSWNPIDVASGFFSGGWEAIKLFTIELPKFLNNILVEVGNILGISYFAPFVYLIAVITVIFGVLAIIMKVRA